MLISIVIVQIPHQQIGKTILTIYFPRIQHKSFKLTKNYKIYLYLF